MTITGDGAGAGALAPADAARARDAVKALIRLGGAGEDALLDDLVRQAVAVAEAFVGQLLVARPVVERVPARANWTRLASTPVRAVASVTGLGADALAVALPPGAYALDIDADGDAWVRASAPGVVRLEVTLAAGLASGWDMLPPPLQMATVRLAAHAYQSRDGGGDPPAAVTALLRPWRRLRLHPEHAA